MSELSVGSIGGISANSFVVDVASGSTLDLSTGAKMPAGSIIAVKDAIFTGIQTASVTAGGNVAVTDLSITHEVADPANKLIISAFIGVGGASEGFAQIGIAVAEDGSLINVGTSVEGRVALSAGGNVQQSGGTQAVTSHAVTFTHTPGAGSKVYTVRAVNARGGTQTLYINRSQDDTNNLFFTRGVSSLVIQEVAG
jgi:hypothetical protein